LQREKRALTFIQYVEQLYLNFRWQYIIELIFLYILLSATFSFYKKHNGTWFVYVQAAGIFLAALSCLLDFSGHRIYIYIIILLLTLFPVVLFTADIRRGLFRLSWRSKFGSPLTHLDLGQEELIAASENILRACLDMSKSDTGALIIILDKVDPVIAESGVAVNAVISSQLLEALFFPKSPMHDGAVMVVGNSVVAAGCYLPLSSRTDLPRELGTRHRAAIGLTEQLPQATAIVVSEETSIISAVHDGKMIRYLDGETLLKILKHALKVTIDGEEERAIWGKINE
jgi:diadenylate cyclase